VVEAEGPRPPVPVEARLTRADLTDVTLERLARATQRGQRLLLGYDHQVGMPRGLAIELGLDGSSGQDALRALVAGSYDPDAPAVSNPRVFAPAFNAWCQRRGRPPYFYSAIRAQAWRLPARDPRGREDSPTRYRRCERDGRSPLGRGHPKPLSRVGDNGSVGGQSLLGWVELVRLLDACRSEQIALRTWPLDGLDIDSAIYDGAHVWIEPYPAAVRALDVPYDDLNDALAAALFAQHADRSVAFEDPFDLGPLPPEVEGQIEFEGWIFGYRRPSG